MALPLDRGTEFMQITYSINDGIAQIELNRPRYRNAQSRILLEEMDIAFAMAERDSTVKVVLLTGSGEHFSSGHDLGTPEEMADREIRPREETLAGRHISSWERYCETALRWRDFPKPTIAVVQGYCIFGGWLIASAMDFVIAADNAKFLPSLLQYFSVPFDLGARKSKEILFRGQFLDASEAAGLGFVNHVVPLGELHTFAHEIATEIAEHDPFELRMLKNAVNSAQDHMGFRSSILDGYSYYSLMMSEAQIRAEQITDRRLAWVDRSLSRLADSERNPKQ